MEKAAVIMLIYAVLTAYLIRNFVLPVVVEFVYVSVTGITMSRYNRLRELALLVTLVTVVLTYIFSVPLLHQALNTPYPYQDRLLARELGVLLNLAVLLGYLFKPGKVTISIKRRQK